MSPMARLAMFYLRITHGGGLIVDKIPNADLLGTVYVPVKVNTLSDYTQQLMKKC